MDRAFVLSARLAVALLAVAGGAAEAAHPLLTEDTGTQGEGNVQLEVMVDKARDHPPGAKVRELQTTMVLSYGLLDQADLQLGLPYLRQHLHDALGRRADRGPLDATVDLKWRFYESDGLSLGLKPGITLPDGNERRGFGSGRVTWGALLILSFETGPWAFHSHAGYRRNNNSANQRDALAHVSGALTYKATEQIRLVADLSADSNPDRANHSSLRYSVLGFIYSATPKLDFDVGLKHGHGQAATDRALLVGATLRW